MFTGKLIDQQVTKYKGLSNITDAPPPPKKKYSEKSPYVNCKKKSINTFNNTVMGVYKKKTQMKSDVKKRCTYIMRHDKKNNGNNCMCVSIYSLL